MQTALCCFLPGSVYVKAVDVEGQKRHNVRQHGKGKGQAQAGGESNVPQDHFNEGRHQPDVA